MEQEQVQNMGETCDLITLVYFCDYCSLLLLPICLLVQPVARLSNLDTTHGIYKKEEGQSSPEVISPVTNSY